MVINSFHSDAVQNQIGESGFVVNVNVAYEKYRCDGDTYSIDPLYDYPGGGLIVNIHVSSKQLNSGKTTINPVVNGELIPANTNIFGLKYFSEKDGFVVFNQEVLHDELLEEVNHFQKLNIGKKDFEIIVEKLIQAKLAILQCEKDVVFSKKIDDPYVNHNINVSICGIL